MDKYKVLDTLGTGSYGSVYKSEDKETGELVAIKKMKKKYTNWDECKNLREVKSLNAIKHENIIKIKEMIRENDILHLVFEYMESNLYDLMQKKTIKRFSENEIKNIIWQLVKGIAHMHKYGFFHRDLKPENILVKNETNIKLADFGLAREIRSIPPYTEYVSTRWYRAPECLLSSNNYNSPIDIWAIGAIMSELYCGKPLFPGNNNKDMLLKICRIIGPPTTASWPEGLKMSKKIDFKFPNSANLINFSSGNATNAENSPKGLKLDISYSLRSIVKEASDEAIKFMEDILRWDPNKRPTASELLEHPFLKGYTGIKERVKENPIESYNFGLKESNERAESGVKSRISSRRNGNFGEKKTPDINKILDNIKNERKNMRANLNSNSKAKEKEKEFISNHILNKNSDFNTTNDNIISNLIDYGNNLKKEAISQNVNSNIDFLMSKETDKYTRKPNLGFISNHNDSLPKPLFEKRRIYPMEKNANKIDNESKYKNDLDSAIPEEIGYSGIDSLLPPIANNIAKKENNFNRENNINNFNKYSRLNNLLKFNNFGTNANNLNNISAGIGIPNNAFFSNMNNLNNNNNFGNRERENSGLKKRNFFDEEKNIFGNIKENLERDIEIKQNYVIKNREYSLNDRDLARNNHLKLNNLRENKFSRENNYGIKENLNMNLNNINNFPNVYNPVLTNVRNINNEIFNKEIIKQKNFDPSIDNSNNVYNYNYNNEDKEMFKNSKKRWDFDINNIMHHGSKRESIHNNPDSGNTGNNSINSLLPNYNSRRKILRGINDKNSNNINNNNTSLFNRKENFDLKEVHNSVVNNNNIISIGEGPNFNSRRQHFLNKIAV